MEENTAIKKKKRKNKVTFNGLFKFFVIFFLANLFVCTVLAAASGGDSWKSMLFHSGNYTDLFMDFFNSIRDGGSDNVYSERNNIYPPLCVLIFRFFSKLISPDLVSSIFKQRTLLQTDTVSMMIYFVFAIICILSLVRLIESYANIKNDAKFKTQASVLSFMMIISYPVMFCLERGNILILSVICSMFFIFFRDSENRLIKELSYISLAVAAGIKLYPAVFGLILVIEKKYKDALRLVLYGVIVVVAPIVFFLDEFTASAAAVNANAPQLISINAAVTADSGASSMIAKLLNNLLSFAVNKKSRLNFSSVSIQNFVFMANGSATAAKIICLITEIIAVVAAFFSKREWQRVFLLTYLMLNIPSASNSYALSFMLIPFMIFLFGNEGFRSSDKIIIVCYSLLLTPLPTLWYYHPEVVENLFASLGLYYNTLLNQNIATFVFQFLFFFVLIDIITSISSRRKSKKSLNETEITDREDAAA